MSQSPRRDDSSLDLEALSSEELGRVPITVEAAESQRAEETVRPPANRRCDSAHRELLRQPFLLDR